MKRFIFMALVWAFLFSSCNKVDNGLKEDEYRINFLNQYGIVVNKDRPYYNSDGYIPKIFDAAWEMRNVFSKETLKIDLTKYRGKNCTIHMYPVSKLPFDVKKEDFIDTRAVVVCYKNKVISSYIEFVSELRTLPAMSLKGKTIENLSGIKWDTWKEKMEGDDYKHLVIWQYYEALRLKNYEDAYKFIYDKNHIKKEDFINTAKNTVLLYIDFLNIDQYKNPSRDEAYFTVKAEVSSGDKGKKKTYDINFDLKRDPDEKEYGGWKIYKTMLK